MQSLDQLDDGGGKAGLDFSSPDHSLEFLTRTLFRSFSRAIERRSMLLGISGGQWTFLRQLWLEDGITQHELSVRVGRREATTVIAINGLVQAGLVRRTPSATDRRKIHIHLTPRARDLKSKVLAIESAVNALASTEINAGELATFHRVLGRINTNLADDLREAPAASDED